MKDSRTVGEKIRELREAFGWSQEELARRAGVSTRTVLRVENGQTANPSAQTLAQIAAGFGQPPDFFEGGVDRLGLRISQGVDQLIALTNKRTGWTGWGRDAA